LIDASGMASMGAGRSTSGIAGNGATEVDRGQLQRALRPENSPGFLLWQATNQWQRRMREVLEPLGLTQVQYVLLAGLAWLQQKEPGVSQARLAQFCRTDPMMTSQVLRALERAGLIERASHATDRRARALRLTAGGATALNEAMPRVLAADAAFFGDTAPEAAGTLRRLLGR
jgi:DNA-binding MarR family transcriptional regulator